jgi:hypothetical protein
MNLEDEYHATKSNPWLTVYVTDGCLREVSPREKVYASHRVRNLVEELGEGEFSSVEDGTHPAIRLRDDSVQLNHRKIGGPMFLRLGEALLDAPHCALPQYSLLGGLLAVAYHFVYLLYFFLWCSTRDNVQSRELLSSHKRYEFAARAVRERGDVRFLVYHTFLHDALRVVGKNEILVGFSVVFEGGSGVNDVGLVLLRFTASMTVEELRLAFQRRAGVGTATNLLSRSSQITKYVLRQSVPGRSVRERLDLIVTAIVANTDSNVEVSIKAAGPVYEGAYVSLISRVTSGGDVHVIARASSHDPGWGCLESIRSAPALSNGTDGL